MIPGMCGKLKYGKGDGRKRRRQWIFGGVSRTSGRFFMSLCPENKRTRKALWPIIQVDIKNWLKIIFKSNNICRQILWRAPPSTPMAGGLIGGFRSWGISTAGYGKGLKYFV